MGEANASGGASLDQALRFNGKKWTHVKTPQPGGTAIGNLTEPMGVGARQRLPAGRSGR